MAPAGHEARRGQGERLAFRFRCWQGPEGEWSDCFGSRLGGRLHAGDESSLYLVACLFQHTHTLRHIMAACREHFMITGSRSSHRRLGDWWREPEAIFAPAQRVTSHDAQHKPKQPKRVDHRAYSGLKQECGRRLDLEYLQVPRYEYLVLVLVLCCAAQPVARCKYLPCRGVFP